MRKLRKLICLTLTILLALSAMLPVAAEGTSAPNITSIRPTVLPANANEFYFYINGSNLGTSSSSRVVEIYDPAQPGTNQIIVNGLSGSGSYLRVACKTVDSNGLMPKQYTLKVTIDGQSAEYTVDAIDTPVIPYIRPTELPANPTTIDFRLEGSNFDLLTNGNYRVELYVLDEGSNEIIAATADASNMINNTTVLDLKVNFTKPELLTVGKVVNFRIVGPTEVYYGAPLQFNVVDTPIITKYNNIRFNNSVNDSSNANYEFQFYGYNLSGKPATAEIKLSNGQLVETLTATGVTLSDGQESVIFTLSKEQHPLSGSYYVKVLPNSSSYSITVQNSAPVIKSLRSAYLPSGYGKFAVKLIGTGFGQSTSAIKMYLYDSANNNILNSIRSVNISSSGPTDQAIDAELYLISTYNNGLGLIKDESYSLVVEVNNVKSQPISVGATDAPMIYKPLAWHITPDATKYYVEFKGYNLQTVEGKITGASMIDNTSGTPVTIGTTTKVELITDYIDNEHLKFYFDSVDLSGMSIGEAAAFEINSSVPLLYVTGTLGIRLSNDSYVTSYGYDDRLSLYYYNAYGFNLAGSYTMTFTYNADPTISYSMPLEMLTEDNVFYKSNVSIPKSSDWPTGDYKVVMKDSLGNTLASRTDYLVFDNSATTISSIRPEVIPANEHIFYFYIEGSSFGYSSDALTIELYDPDDATPDVQENLINLNNIAAWGNTVRVACNTVDKSGLAPKNYMLRVTKNGSQSVELPIDAIDTPVMPYMSPSELPINAVSLDMYLEGGNFDLLSNGSYTVELYTKDSSNNETIVGSLNLPNISDNNVSYYNFTVPITRTDLMTNGTKVYFRITGPTTVYFGVPQELMVVDTPIESGFNYERPNQSFNDTNNPYIEFEFWGFNLDGKQLTAEIMNNSFETIKTLTAQGYTNDQGIESVIFQLPKSDNLLLEDSQYLIRMNPSNLTHGFILHNNNTTIAGINEERIANSIADSAISSYEFELNGANLTGRKFTAELRDSQGALLETLYSVGVKDVTGYESITFRLPKFKRVLAAGSYTLKVVGYNNEYPFTVTADTNNKYNIYLNVSHDIASDDYSNLNIVINGHDATYKALEQKGNYVIEGVVNGVYDIKVKQPKYLSKNISVVVNNADSIANNVVLKGGDSTGDGIVDIDDLTILAMNYEAANIDIRADIDNSGAVDLKDLAALALNYGKESNKSLSIENVGGFLDPNLVNSTTDIVLVNSLFEGLVRVYNGQAKPGMSDSWAISEDGLTYTFHLRDAYWSDGVPVTANDFKYSILRLLDPEFGSEYAYQGYYIENGEAYNTGMLDDPSLVGVRVIDEKTLEIKLKAPCAYFLKLMSFVSFMPVRQDIVEMLGDGFGNDVNNMVFNGPYLPENWNMANTQNTKRILKRNPYYWDKQSVNMDTINMYFTENNNQAVGMYEAGILDTVNLSNDNISKYQQNGSIRYTPDGSTWYMQLNVKGKANDDTQGTGKFLNNLNFRKAIALAIDRQQFVDSQTKGISQAALRYVHPMLIGVSDYYSVEKPLDYYTSGAQKASALQYLQAALTELGETNIPTFEFLADNNPTSYNRALELKNMLWENLGINLEIKQVEFSDRMKLMSLSQYDIVFAGWGPDYNDPMTFLDIWATGSSFNNTNWSSSVYDELIDFSKTTTDMNARLDAMFDAEKYLLDNGPIIPVFFRNYAYVQRPEIQGMGRNFIGPQIDFTYVDINE